MEVQTMETKRIVWCNAEGGGEVETQTVEKEPPAVLYRDGEMWERVGVQWGLYYYALRFGEQIGDVSQIELKGCAE